MSDETHRAPGWSAAHTWEVERHLARLKAEEIGRQNFPLIQALEAALFLLAHVGETGQHPYGQLDDSDEGELRMGIAVDARQAVIRLVFGKPVAWLGLPAAHAKWLAHRLLEGAGELDRKRT